MLKFYVERLASWLQRHLAVWHYLGQLSLGHGLTPSFEGSETQSYQHLRVILSQLC